MIQLVTALTFGAVGLGSRREAGSAETREVLADVGWAALVSAVAELGPELGGVGAARVPSLAQVGGALVEDAGLPAGAVVHEQFLGAGSPGEAPDRAAGQPQIADDLRLGAPFGQQAVHVGVPVPGPGGHPTGPRRLRLRRRLLPGRR
jgi:hypothetical protein